MRPTALPTRRPSVRPVARGLAAVLLVLSGVRASPAHADPDWSLVPDDSSGQSSARPTAPPAPDTGYLPWQKAQQGGARSRSRSPPTS
ncbi:hypothetical protein ACWEPC_48450, partial [Nonomuraea sp. NPDC004297]